MVPITTKVPYEKTMDESEDLRKIDEIINKHKTETETSELYEYAEFIDYGDLSDPDETEDYILPDFPKSDITQFNTYTPSDLLKIDEKQIAEACKNAELKTLLLLNRNKNVQLMHLYKKIKDLLMECQENICLKSELIRGLKKKRKFPSRVWRIGSPYFKTKDDYPAPRNLDTMKKFENGELLFYDMTPSAKWTEKEMTRLLKGVAFSYKSGKENELQKEIDNLEEASQNKTTLKIKELKIGLQDLKDSEVDQYPSLNSETFLDWHRIAEHFLNDKYTHQECRIFWHTYLHPSINKTGWTEEENETLKTVAKMYGEQNWEEISRELNNSRTGFIACIHYYSKLNKPTSEKNRFKPSEDKLIMELVQRYKQGGIISWTKIAHHFKNRTRQQLFHRYRYYLSVKNHTQKGKFTEAEDVLILILVDRFGHKFSKCQKYFDGSRSMVQLKARYNANLRSDIKKGAFTLEEDHQLLSYVNKYSKKVEWEPLVKVMNRCGAQLRQRHKVLCQFLQKPGANLEDAPRRKHFANKLIAGFNFLRCIADKFKNSKKIPTLNELEKLLIITPRTESVISIDDKVDVIEEESPNFSIDDLLTEFFSNSIKLTFEQTVGPGQIFRATGAVSNVLSILQANLEIPRDFHKNPKLDLLDNEILKNLVANKPTVNNTFLLNSEVMPIGKLVPPNLNTVVGMRSLLIKNQIYKARNSRKGNHIFENFREQSNQTQIVWCISNHLLRQTESIRSQLISERNLFFRRFVTLFKFPAIMTLERPCVELESTSKYWSEELSNVTRTYQRKTKPTAQNKAVIKLEHHNEGMPFEKIFIQEHKDFDNQPCASTSNKNSAINTDGKNTTPCEKISIADKLKRQINDTIDELSNNVHKERFPSWRYNRGNTNKTEEKDVEIVSVSRPRTFPKKTKKRPVISAPTVQDNTKTSVETFSINLDIDRPTHPEKKSRIKSENSTVSKFRVKTDVQPTEGAGSFDFSRGELILEESEAEASMADEDLEDLNALNTILKKEHRISDESYDLV